jgi:threonine/homoserine/homoserine lactone efflux protein
MDFSLPLFIAAALALIVVPVHGALSGWLRLHPGVRVGLYRTSAVVLIGLGVRLALEPRP